MKEFILQNPLIIFSVVLTFMYFIKVLLTDIYSFLQKILTQLLAQTKLMIIIAVIGATAYYFTSNKPEPFFQFLKTSVATAVEIIK